MAKELIQKADAILKELQSSGTKGSKSCKKGKACGAGCVKPDFSCVLPLPAKLNPQITAVAKDLYSNKSYNWAEMVTAVVAANPEVKTKKELIEALKDNKIQVTHPDRYIENLNLRSDKMVEEYITNTREKLAPVLGKVERVYILGATKQDAFPEVVKVNSHIPADQKKQLKADIIAITSKGPVGISVKSSPGDRTTNFSLEKMTGEDGKKLRVARKAYIDSLKKKGMSEREIRDDFAKKEGNSYTRAFEKFVDNHKKQIIDQWIQGVGVEQVKYPLYQFDGKNLKDQQKLGRYLRANEDKIELKVQPRTGKGTSVYYEVFVAGKKEYQWEFRKWETGSTNLETRVRTNIAKPR
jgi:hypothetical protein